MMKIICFLILSLHQAELNRNIYTREKQTKFLLVHKMISRSLADYIYGALKPERRQYSEAFNLKSLVYVSCCPVEFIFPRDFSSCHHFKLRHI